MDTLHGHAALADKALYQSIILNRKKFNQLRGMDYSLHLSSKINFIPPANIMHLWEDDYRLMRNTMIYGKAKNFHELIDRLNELIASFRLINFRSKLLISKRKEWVYINTLLLPIFHYFKFDFHKLSNFFNC